MKRNKQSKKNATGKKGKLQLRRETLRKLSSEELAGVAGGTFTQLPDPSPTLACGGDDGGGGSDLFCAT